MDATAWDALVGDGSPFLEHAFLWALESTGCAVPDTGWDPRPILVHDDAGKLVAGAPAWLKAHSMGEFVYDHGWAAAAERAGIPYYPKLVVGVPFSPVGGERFLGDPAYRELLLAAIREAARPAKGIHVLFDTPGEAAWLASKGLFPRVQFQYWWRNEGYTSHEDFLGRFPSKERNKLRRERKECARFRIDAFTGPDLAVIDAMYGFYADTTARHMWGHAYLSQAFFRKLADTWGHRLQCVVVRDGDAIVAGALNVVKGGRLYGRYWGCKESLPFLHFEVCYHQGIEWCIRHDLAVFEPGHGGEHKYKRGFLPEITWSSHALAHAGLHKGLMDWTAREGAAVRAEVERLRAESPMRPR